MKERSLLRSLLRCCFFGFMLEKSDDRMDPEYLDAKKGTGTFTPGIDVDLKNQVSRK